MLSLGLFHRFTCQTLTPHAKFYGLNSALQIAKTIYVGAFYRPHVSDVTSLEQLKISRNQPSDSVSASQMWVSGDFNAPYIDWSTPMVIPGSPNPNTYWWISYNTMAFYK